MMIIVTESEFCEFVFGDVISAMRQAIECFMFEDVFNAMELIM